jgi:glycolate oxidase FAD binding subunit
LPFFEPPAEDLCLWRLSVPQTAAVIDLPGASAGAQYIEWQGAQRWLWAPIGAAAGLRQAAQAAGGHATLFRASQLGGNQDRQAATGSLPGAVQQRIARELQKQFDPQGVFATGRLGF